MSVAGDAAAGWDARLVDAYQREYLGLVRLAYLLTGDPGVAPEIVQDAFVAARRSWDRERAPEPSGST